MKQKHLALLIGILMLTGVFTVLAQSDTAKQYTSKDIIWRVHDQVDYQGGKKGYGSFINVAADADGKIYIANASKEFSALVIDAKTGKTLSTIKDSSGTINKFYDVAPAADDNIWVADNTSMVYLLDPKGAILLSIPFTKSPGLADRQPIKIGVGPDENLYVLYSGSALLMQVFTPKGEFMRTIVTGTATLGGISFFAFAPDGTLFIEGNGIGWISEESGKTVMHELASDFMKQSGFIQYRGLIIDTVGSVYFSAGADMDKANSIFKLNKDGKLLAQYGKAQERKNWGNDFGTDELSFTVSLALDSENNLIISDTNNIFSQLIKINMQD